MGVALALHGRGGSARCAGLRPSSSPPPRSPPSARGWPWAPPATPPSSPWPGRHGRRPAADSAAVSRRRSLRRFHDRGHRPTALRARSGCRHDDTGLRQRDGSDRRRPVDTERRRERPVRDLGQRPLRGVHVDGQQPQPSGPDADLDVFRKDLTTGAVDLISVNSAGQKATPRSSATRTVVRRQPGLVRLGHRDQPLRGRTPPPLRHRGARRRRRTTSSPRRTTGGCRPTAPQSARRSRPTARGGVRGARRHDQPRSQRHRQRRTTPTSATWRRAPPRPRAFPRVATGSGFPDISGDGRFVGLLDRGFAYDATNDANGANDVTGAICHRRRRFHASLGAGHSDAAGNAGGIGRPISADGSRVSFTSTSVDLTTADSNAAVTDVYTRDIGDEATVRASTASDGTTQSRSASEHRPSGAPGAWSRSSSLTRLVTKLVPGDTNTRPTSSRRSWPPPTRRAR